MKHWEPLVDVCLVHYGQCQKTSETQRLDKIVYYLQRRYMSEIPETAKEFISRSLDYEAEEKMGYTYNSSISSY